MWVNRMLIQLDLTLASSTSTKETSSHAKFSTGNKAHCYTELASLPITRMTIDAGLFN